MAEADRKQAAPLPAAEAPFDAIGLAKSLLRKIRSGALATLERQGEHEGGAPFASLVTVATDVDGTPLLLLSRLSAHTLNLEADPRCSLLLSQGGKGDPLAHPRLTVTGRAERSAEPGRGRASSPATRRPRSTPTSPTSRSSAWRSGPGTSTAASRRPRRSRQANSSPISPASRRSPNPSPAPSPT